MFSNLTLHLSFDERCVSRNWDDDDDDDDDDESMKLMFAHSYSKNRHECANEDMLWQTVNLCGITTNGDCSATG